MPSSLPRERLLLLGAEGVVVNGLDRLLERLLGRHAVDVLAARRRVGELAAVDHIAAAQLERVHSDLARHHVDELLAVVSIIHGPRYAALPHVFV